VLKTTPAFDELKSRIEAQTQKIAQTQSAIANAESQTEKAKAQYEYARKNREGIAETPCNVPKTKPLPNAPKWIASMANAAPRSNAARKKNLNIRA
jgi:multidrug resistance efflux pump